MLLLKLTAPSITLQCDARCYNGLHSAHCRCVCQGMNHGAGVEQASQNTSCYYVAWFARFEAQYGRIDDIYVNEKVFYTQEELFPGYKEKRGTSYIHNHLDEWLGNASTRQKERRASMIQYSQSELIIS